VTKDVELGLYCCHGRCSFLRCVYVELQSNFRPSEWLLSEDCHGIYFTQTGHTACIVCVSPNNIFLKSNSVATQMAETRRASLSCSRSHMPAANCAAPAQTLEKLKSGCDEGGGLARLPPSSRPPAQAAFCILSYNFSAPRLSTPHFFTVKNRLRNPIDSTFKSNSHNNPRVYVNSNPESQDIW
jgi:hypothetical protein